MSGVKVKSSKCRICNKSKSKTENKVSSYCDKCLSKFVIMNGVKTNE